MRWTLENRLRPTGVCVAALAAVAAVAAAAGAARADVRPLSLYERTARASLVVRAEVTDGEHRLAVLRTRDVVKCSIPERPGDSFRIAYKLDSFTRRPWEDKISFRTGERVLLFLRKFTKEDGEKPEGDLYTLLWGAQGKFLLPPEGEEAHVQAVTAFAAVQAIPALEEQEARLEEMIADRNPIIAEAALEQLHVQGLGDPALIPSLVAFFDHDRETLRLGAMRLLRRILEDARLAGTAVPAREDLADRIRGLVVADPAAALRAEAVGVLHALGGEDARAFLRRVSREDPSQAVRYEAEKALLSWPEGP